MLQVNNATPYPATLSVFPSPQGVECAYAHIKVSYDLSSGSPVLSPRQAGFLAADGINHGVKRATLGRTARRILDGTVYLKDAS